MLNENTMTKLQEMHLTVMAKALREQLSDPNMNSLSFEDRMGLLVDAEWTSRKNNHLIRLIKNAGFADTEACIENIEYHSDRNLDKAQIARLATCNYISERHNVMLLGATGSGKTYLACALGMAAARNFLSVKYIRLPELLDKKYGKFFLTIQKVWQLWQILKILTSGQKKSFDDVNHRSSENLDI